MTVYVLAEEDIEHHAVVAVFLSKREAEKHRFYLRVNEPRFRNMRLRIEEHAVVDSR